MAGLKFYALSTCDSCRRARSWLRAHGHAFEEKAIRETPPTREELRTVLAAYGGEVRRLFNTAGQEYRAGGLKDKLQNLSEAEALALLAGCGSLVKRPVVVGPNVALVGFDPEAWSRAFRASARL